MNELKIFENEEFGSIRTVEIDGKPYFVANDVANALGYIRPADAITAHCKGSVKYRLPSNGGEQEYKVIPEGDIYRLIIKSKLPTAEKFERWVFDEVIPSIRKNGGYIANQENLSPEQIVANALVVAQKIIADRDRQIQEMQPKVDFFDAVADSKDAIEIGQVAKVLNVPGVGRNKLFEILRDRNILMDGINRNVPYQKYIDRGYFRTIEQKYTLPDGSTRIDIKTLVYQKGVDAIRKLLRRDYE